jgi:YggT family protein
MGFPNDTAHHDDGVSAGLRSPRGTILFGAKNLVNVQHSISYQGKGMTALTQLLLNILNFISLLLTIYIWLLIVYAVMSWLIAFNVVNTRNQFVHTAQEFLYRITEPVLRPIRRVLPNFGGLDISPIIVMLIIIFIQDVILPFIAALIA